MFKESGSLYTFGVAFVIYKEVKVALMLVLSTSPLLAENI